MIWAGAEIAVTMVCIGIAVCRPLYKRIYTKLSGQHDHRGFDSDPPSYEQPRQPPPGDADQGIPAIRQHRTSIQSDKSLPRSWFGGNTESSEKTGRHPDDSPSRNAANVTPAQGENDGSWV